jgi:hypothetical protein
MSTMLRSAAVLALAGAASAQTFNNDTASCTAMSNMISCGFLDDEECAAATNCEIATDKGAFYEPDECIPVATHADVLTNDFTIGEGVMQATYMSCAAVLNADGEPVSMVAQADCTGLCEWVTEDSRCGPKDASIYSAIVASGANAGTKGFMMVAMQGNECDALTTQATCEANLACEYEEDACEVKVETTLALVKNKCLDKVDFSDIYAGK